VKNHAKSDCSDPHSSAFLDYMPHRVRALANFRRQSGGTPAPIDPPHLHGGGNGTPVSILCQWNSGTFDRNSSFQPSVHFFLSD
jgi:hypothetical protein